MPVKASKQSPVQRPSMDGHVSAARTARVRSVSAGLDHEPAPIPLPSDPKIQAELLAGIEAGMADARAGRGVDFEDVLADWDARLASLG
jgi:hypothetical protein